jgi:hypothetical protein
MKTPNPVLDPPVQDALDRGTKTLRKVLSMAGSRSIGSLQTTTNEVGYLMAAARLAIEAFGADPKEKHLHAARLRGLDRMVALRKAAEPVLETGQVCALLGVSRETIRKKVDRRQLLAIPKGGDRVFPAFQFQEGDVLPGIPEVLAALDTDSPFVVLSFLLSRSQEFSGKSACELLQAGEVEKVAAEARGFLGHGG